jgi:hypothetical protein
MNVRGWGSGRHNKARQDLLWREKYAEAYYEETFGIYLLT